MAPIFNLLVHQMDESTAFLYGGIKERIYLEQLEGFVKQGDEHKACLLLKSLYGLKQSAKNWYEKFTNDLLVARYTRSNANYNLYIKVQGSFLIMIALYVEDLIIVSNNLSFLLDSKIHLSKTFSMTHNKDITYFLDIQVSDNLSYSSIHLSQKKSLIY